MDLDELEKIAQAAASEEQWYYLKTEDHPEEFEIGPWPIENKPARDSYYEDTIAVFYGGNFNAEANAKFVTTFHPKFVLELIEALKITQAIWNR
jgi:hypothetical protein